MIGCRLSAKQTVSFPNIEHTRPGSVDDDSARDLILRPVEHLGMRDFAAWKVETEGMGTSHSRFAKVMRVLGKGVNIEFLHLWSSNLFEPDTEQLAQGCRGPYTVNHNK